MHCYICDREDDHIAFDRRTRSFTPCSVCQNAIEECLDEYDQEDDEIFS